MKAAIKKPAASQLAHLLRNVFFSLILTALFIATLYFLINSPA